MCPRPLFCRHDDDDTTARCLVCCFASRLKKSDAVRSPESDAVLDLPEHSSTGGPRASLAGEQDGGTSGVAGRGAGRRDLGRRRKGRRTGDRAGGVAGRGAPVEDLELLSMGAQEKSHGIAGRGTERRRTGGARRRRSKGPRRRRNLKSSTSSSIDGERGKENRKRIGTQQYSAVAYL
ncbi:hypothetical protein GQ55_3G387800 [Panicum hallii var. hallii]|uniref:Uncharacterized protein n=1 Tax=Panicum hallii var. hallii TaxID=1504633 RepID=A0A2T7EGH6_9POAL|nr:hypothetical protein GQ55_3G387800 [Panicum hallii var. hallii]